MIGMISDSHDNLDMIRLAVGLFNDAECTLVIHAGDFVAPFAAAELRGLKARVKAVFGNCDGEKQGLEMAFGGIGEISEPPSSFTHAGLNFTVCHSDAGIERLLASVHPDVLVFGHTHKPMIERRGDTLLINPGESGGWLHGKATVALFDPESGEAKIVPL